MRRHTRSARLPGPTPPLSGLVLALMLLVPCGAAAQVGALVWPPESALVRLASGEPDLVSGAGNVVTAAFGQNYARYSPAERQRLLDGVERIARGEAGTDELRTRRSITEAFSILAVTALDSIPVPEDREIPRRVLRIYRESNGSSSRAQAVYLLAQLLPRYPASRAEIETLLFEVASAPSAPGRVAPISPINALLLYAGEAGIPVLRRLHEQGAVQEPGAAVFLREVAKQGYRWPK